MSLVSMANAAAARRSDYLPAGGAPSTPSAVARAATAAVPTATPNGHATPAGAISDFMKVAATYVPTEVITAYLVIVGALSKPEAFPSSMFWLFLFFVLGTAFMVWCAFAARLRADGRPLPLAFRTWPLWEMTAGTVAFVAWALALPSNPFSPTRWYSAPVAGATVGIVTVLLGALAPLFQRRLPD
jgi:hypothetical protein